MGIISDFLNINLQIEDLKTSNKFLDRIMYSSRKRKLHNAVKKLKNANEPLNIDQILELFQSLHGLCVANNQPFFDNNVTIEYFPGNSSYRLTSKSYDDEIKTYSVSKFVIVASKKNNDIELEIEITDKDIVKNYRVNLKSVHTNIKEIQDYVKYCNHRLYDLIYLYILYNI